MLLFYFYSNRKKFFRVYNENYFYECHSSDGVIYLNSSCKVKYKVTIIKLLLY